MNYRHSFQYKAHEPEPPRETYKAHEPNGNYQDSDEDMDASPPRSYVNTIRMENGIDSSDHDANDNPVQTPGENSSMTSKPQKTVKRKMKKKWKAK